MTVSDRCCDCRLVLIATTITTLDESMGSTISSKRRAEKWSTFRHFGQPLARLEWLFVTADPSGRIEPLGHALTKRRMRPVCGMFLKTMLDRVEVRVVQVSRKVSISADRAPSTAAAKCRVRHGWSWPVIGTRGRAELSRMPS